MQTSWRKKKKEQGKKQKKTDRSRKPQDAGTIPFRPENFSGRKDFFCPKKNIFYMLFI